MRFTVIQIMQQLKKKKVTTQNNNSNYRCGSCDRDFNEFYNQLHWTAFE
jgi:transposase-like protein